MNLFQKWPRLHEEERFSSLDGTSELSPYIALGMISIKNLINQAKQANNGNLSGGNEGLTCWVSELCWRDFYQTLSLLSRMS